jgi:hypothetical protein
VLLNSSPYVGVIYGLPMCSILPSFPIFQGDAKTLTMKVAPSLIVNDPLDLTGATEIVVNLAKADGTTLQRKLSLAEVTVVDAKLGKFTTAISAVNSALLLVGELQTFDVTFTIGSLVTTIQFVGALSVYQA